MSNQNRSRASGKNNVALIVAAVAVLAIGGYGLSIALARGKVKVAEQMTFKVEKGPLRISVIESGTIKAKDITTLKCELEDDTTVLSIITEGARVNTGDLLVELDSTSLVDDQLDRNIRLQSAEAAFVSARENLAIVENQAKSDTEIADLKLTFAREDLTKYIEGEYPKLKTEAAARIKLAEEELQRADDTLQSSAQLYKEKYISKTEYMTEELSHSRKELDLQLAKNNLSLLENFTYGRQLAQLKSDASQAEMSLERIKRKGNANIVQAQAELKAKESELNQQMEKLKQVEDQIGKTKLYAPGPAQVIYATSAQREMWHGNQEPLKVGATVYERQELIYLPTTDACIIDTSIHEASLKKVSVGLPVIITVDALPDKQFWGKVTTIAPLPDPQSMFMNPDLKVYNAVIDVDGIDQQLRTGMSCNAEIIVQQLDNVLFVPVQAVIRVKGQPHVYVKSGDEYLPRPVQLGMDNNRMVHITGGLKEGEEVSMTPPLQSGEKMDSSQEPDETMNNQIKEKLQNAVIESHGNGNGNSLGNRGEQTGSQDGSGKPQGAPNAEQMQRTREQLQRSGGGNRQGTGGQGAGQGGGPGGPGGGQPRPGGGPSGGPSGSGPRP